MDNKIDSLISVSFTWMLSSNIGKCAVFNYYLIRSLLVLFVATSYSFFPNIYMYMHTYTRIYIHTPVQLCVGLIKPSQFSVFSVTFTYNNVTAEKSWRDENETTPIGWV